MNENKSVNDINFQIREQIAVNKFIGMITVDKKISHYDFIWNFRQNSDSN